MQIESKDNSEFLFRPHSGGKIKIDLITLLSTVAQKNFLHRFFAFVSTCEPSNDVVFFRLSLVVNCINNFCLQYYNKYFFRFVFVFFLFLLISLRPSFVLRLSRNTALTEHRHFIPAYYPSVLLFQQPRFYFFILTRKLYIFRFKIVTASPLIFLTQERRRGGRLRLTFFYLKSLFVFIVLQWNTPPVFLEPCTCFTTTTGLSIYAYIYYILILLYVFILLSVLYGIFIVLAHCFATGARFFFISCRIVEYR